MYIKRYLLLVLLFAPPTIAQSVVVGSAGISIAQSAPSPLFPSGQWTKEAASTALQGSVNHCPANGFGGFGYNFSNNCQGVVKAWTAWAYVPTVDGGIMLEAGGGHSDYAGNELYELSAAFNNGTGQPPGRKLRLTNPSQPASSCTNIDPLSNPTAPNQGHSYQFFVYAPNVNKVFRWQVGAGDTAGDFCGTYKLWALDVTSIGASCNAETSTGCSASWVQLTPANLPTSSTIVEAYAQYNHVDGKIYIWQPADHTNSASLSVYDPVANAYTDRIGALGPSSNDLQHIFIDEKQDIAIIMGNANGGAGPHWYDLTGADSFATHVPSIDASCNNVNNTGGVSGDWDSTRGVIIAYTGQDNAIYYVTLNRTSNIITCTTVSSGSTAGVDYPALFGSDPNPAAGGVLGRFHYDSVNDLYVVDDAYSLPAWAFKPMPMVTLTNPSSSVAITSQVYSVPVVAADGDIANFPQAQIAGSLVTTQADVKNRWPDGSWKYGIASFVVASIPVSAQVNVHFVNQSSGNNTSPETVANMLANYNFDAQIQLTNGAQTPLASARTILTAAQSGSGCTAPSGGDIDGAIATSGHLCTYWLQGSIVTAVILEDRIGRAYDMNPNNDTGSPPLHPSFEAWFYPSTSQALVGFTLENDWASTTTTSSARDQTYSVKLTVGNSSPLQVASFASFTQTPRTRWHQVWCANGTGKGNRDVCGPLVHTNYKMGYFARAGFIPNWDGALPVAPSLITAQVTGLAGANQTLAATTAGIGFYPVNFNATGGGPAHGPLTTWDILYWMTMCDAGNSTATLCGNGSSGDLRSVTLHNADLGNGIPYFYREADSNAGHGQTFDNSGVPGNVQTQGRIVSINARTQVELTDVTDKNACNTNFAADWINYGGSGQDFGAWNDPSNGPQLDPSHWPNLAYTAYLLTGEYGYYEEQVMQAGYAQGSMGGPGSTRACINATAGSSRMGPAGYWDIADNPDRLADWQGREVMLGATIAVDGSPEKAYLTDKVNANIARWEGCQGVTLDVTGYTTAYNFGVSPSAGNPGCAPGSLGNFIEQYFGSGGYSLTDSSDLNQTGANVATGINAHFQNAYSTTVLCWMKALGFLPGSGVLCTNAENYYINHVMDPNGPAMWALGDYVFPTRNASSTFISSWTQYKSLFATIPSSWPACSSTNIDEGYGWEGMAALSWGYGLVSNEGFSGVAAYNKVRNSIGCISKYWLSPNAQYTAGQNFSDASPKWDMTPR